MTTYLPDSVGVLVLAQAVCLYSTGMDGVELDLVCPGGYENFERIVVQRKPHPAVVTDFVACVGCKAMYFAPVRRPDPPESRPGNEMRGIGGPEPRPDSSAALKRDAADAAMDYRKPADRLCASTRKCRMTLEPSLKAKGATEVGSGPPAARGCSSRVERSQALGGAAGHG